jgi:hypothetical protein
MEIISAWKSAKLEKKRGGKKYGKEREIEIQEHISRTNTNSSELLSGFFNTRHLTWDERKALAEAKKNQKKSKKALEKQGSNVAKGSKKSGKVKSRCKYCPFDHDSDYHLRPAMSFPSIVHPPTYGRSQERDPEKMRAEFDAIQKTATATSTGDPVDDSMVERALRASTKEFQNAETGNHNDEVYETAIGASIKEVKLARAEGKQESGVLSTANEKQIPEVEEDDEELTIALVKSLEEYNVSQGKANRTVDPSLPRHYHHHDTDGRYWSDSEDSGMGTEEDELYRKTLEESRRLHTENEKKRAAQGVHEGDDEELRRAIAESEKDAEGLKMQKTEEEIVIEYVKKQSLVE